MFAFTARAESPTIEPCFSLTGEKEGDGLAAVQCVAALAQRVVALQSQSLPADVIVLSATRCEEFGWKPLEESLGRMVIGAGPVDETPPDKKYQVYDVLGKDGKSKEVKLRPYKGQPYTALEAGGAEEVTLTKPQMPRHLHKQTTGVGQPGTGAAMGVAARGVPDVAMVDSRNETRNAGNSLPHPNMPPYIALYFCKKD